MAKLIQHRSMSQAKPEAAPLRKAIHANETGMHRPTTGAKSKYRRRQDYAMCPMYTGRRLAKSISIPRIRQSATSTNKQEDT